MNETNYSGPSLVRYAVRMDSTTNERLPLNLVISGTTARSVATRESSYYTRVLALVLINYVPRSRVYAYGADGSRNKFLEGFGEFLFSIPGN